MFVVVDFDSGKMCLGSVECSDVYGRLLCVCRSYQQVSPKAQVPGVV